MVEEALMYFFGGGGVKIFLKFSDTALAVCNNFNILKIQSSSFVSSNYIIFI